MLRSLLRVTSVIHGTLFTEYDFSANEAIPKFFLP